MSRERKPSRRAARVWNRLTQWYGARLADAYGAICPEDWCEVIDHTDDERLDQALATVRREHLHHPPTLGELEAAIPKRRLSGEQRTEVSIVSEAAVRRLQLCAHQLLRPWSYFGPATNFPARKGRSYEISHPMPRGVVIPECATCRLPSHRVTVDEAEAMAA